MGDLLRFFRCSGRLRKRLGRRLHAQNRALHAVGAGEGIKRPGSFGSGSGELGRSLLHRAVDRIILMDIEQRRDRLFRQGGEIPRRAGEHLEKRVLRKAMNGIGIEDKLVALAPLGLVVLVRADLVGVRGNPHQIHDAETPQGAHTILEGMLLVPVRHDAQTAVIRPKAQSLLLHVAVNGQERADAEISALNIVLLDKSKDEVLVAVHQVASIQYER